MLLNLCSRMLSVSHTIGIGCGDGTDGQVLVLHDMLGLTECAPKFVTKYMEGAALVKDALNQYAAKVAAH